MIGRGWRARLTLTAVSLDSGIKSNTAESSRTAWGSQAKRDLSVSQLDAENSNSAVQDLDLRF